MEAPAAHYHQQQYYQATVTPTATDTTTTTAAAQPYDPSHSYYSSYPQSHSQPPYDYSNSSYYYPHYSTSAYDPNSIHPPGVASAAAAADHLYYPPSQPPSHYAAYYQQPSQPAYGSGGGRSTRGRGRGAFGRYGKGRGGGRGVHATSQSSAPNSADVGASKPQPQMAWCELCRVDCNTHEILEKHRSGKKHQRNLKVFQELQTMTKPITVVNPQDSVTQPTPDGNPFPTEPVPSAEAVQESADTTLPYLSQPFGGRGGVKRKMRGGRGAKWIRAPDGSRRLAEPPKPKPQLVPILCELCNVKCESQMVYSSHVAGKKHLSTLKRYQGHKETFGEGVEALYPTIPNLPSVPIAPQTYQQVPQGAQPYQHIPQDAQALASMILSQQNIPDPQGTQAAVAELLNQHGIHDAQTLIVQLLPYLLTQSQQPVSEVGRNDAPLYPQNEAPQPVLTEAEGQDGEIKTGEQNLAGNVGVEPEAEAVAEASTKTDEGSSEAGKGKVEAE